MSKIADLEKKTEIIQKAVENELSEKNPVPFIAWESDMVRNECREDKNRIITIVLIICLSISNMAWLYVFQSYDYTSTTETYTTESTDGGNALINKEGSVNINGESKHDDNDNDKN